MGMDRLEELIMQQNLVFVDLINEFLKATKAKICITAEELVTANIPDGEKRWIAHLRVGEEGKIIKVKAETLEPFLDKVPMKIKATGIYLDILKKEFGFIIE